MKSLVRKHQKKINGTLGCFDRILFRGYLPIQNGWAMAYFLYQNHIMFRNLKDFLTDSANRIDKHAKAMKEINGAFPGRNHLGHEGWRMAPTNSRGKD